MIIFLVVFIGAGVLLSLVEGGSKEKVQNDYCKSECLQNIKSKYTFCC
jgi:hypothetical protein